MDHLIDRDFIIKFSSYMRLKTVQDIGDTYIKLVSKIS